MQDLKEIEIRRRAAEERIANIASMMVRRDIYGTQKRENDAALLSSVAPGALLHG